MTAERAGSAPCGPAPVVVRVLGRGQDSGKTTLCEALARALTARGLACGYVKHTHHEVETDPAGKDTERLGRAGACVRVLGGAGPATVFLPPRRRSGAELVALAAVACDLDVVVVEGGPQIEGALDVETPHSEQETTAVAAEVVSTVVARLAVDA